MFYQPTSSFSLCIALAQGLVACPTPERWIVVLLYVFMWLQCYGFIWHRLHGHYVLASGIVVIKPLARGGNHDSRPVADVELTAAAVRLRFSSGFVVSLGAGSVVVTIRLSSSWSLWPETQTFIMILGHLVRRRGRGFEKPFSWRRSDNEADDDETSMIITQLRLWLLLLLRVKRYEALKVFPGPKRRSWTTRSNGRM